jgi:hypothetical protein
MSRAYLYAVMLAALVLVVPLASGAASDLPPTPTIDSVPPNPSATGTATLTFSDTDPLVAFRCQIDSGAFSLCTSPATYSGLGDGSHTFGVKAIDILLNESDIVSYTWSIDTTPPPPPTITAQPSNPSNDSSPAFHFTDTEEGVSFQCKLDSGGFATCASPVAYTGRADGSHTFTVQATDAAGNTSSASYSWTLDTVVPTITLGTKPPSSSSDATPTFAFSANEATPDGFECRFDGGAFAPCASPTTLGSTPDGSHTFAIRAADAAGNVGSTSHTWTIDTVAPAVTLGTTPPNPSNDSTPGFSFSVNESVPGGFECKLDNGTFAACTSPATLGSTSDGSHTFIVRATDTAGNTGQTSYSWTIDTVAPTVTLDTKPPNPSNDPTPTFAFSANEATPEGFECKLDSGVFAACTSPATLSASSDGSHTFVVRADDAAGNAGSASYSWTIDTVAPTATLTAKPANPSNDSTPSFSFSAGETSTFQCQLDAGAFAPCTSPVTLGSTADGSHTYAVKATDAAGNTGPATSYVWTIDTVAPTITLNIKPPNPTNDATPDFAFSANETVPAGFQCHLDAAAFAACTSPKALAATPDGSHSFTVKASDAAGNTGQTSYTWTIDTAAPQITLDAKPTNPTNNTTPTFAFSANETLLGGFQCKLDGAAFAACTSPKTFPTTADGSHTFTVKAIDTAGNPGQTSYTWTIDTDPPTITLAATPPNPSNDATPTFTFSADEATPGGFQCRLDAGAFAACTSPKTFGTTPDGSHTFTVKGADAAGNNSSTSYAWTIDTSAPVLTLTKTPPNPSGLATAHFEFSATDLTSVSYQCQLDSGGFVPCATPPGQDYSSLTNAAHTFTLKGTDAAGNSSTKPFTWTVDTVNPIVTITAGPPSLSNQISPTFTFTSNKSPSTFQCQLDTSAFAPCTSPLTLGATPEGSHTFNVRATDSLAHTGPPTAFAWTIDTTPPPAPAIGPGPANPTNLTSASFVFSDSEPGLTFQCQRDGGASSACTSPASYSGLPDGAHTFAVRATDAAGNTGVAASKAWTVDTVPPDTTIGSTPPAVSGSDSASFGFASTEPGSAFLCGLDGGTVASCSSPQSYSGLSNGAHAFQVTATDAAGNSDPTAAAFSWQVQVFAPVDRTPPGNVRGLTRSVGYGLLEIAWGRPPDVDFDHVRVLLSTSPKKPAGKVVYTGKASRYMNRSFRNGTYYRYSIVSYDHAGNASHGVTAVVAASALLRSPRDGSVVHSPPLLGWLAIKKASFYNVQLYYGARKVLSRWPRTARLRLGRTWTYAGQDLRLKKGTYHWYVWPGFGPRLKGRYGQLLGESSFRVG